MQPPRQHRLARISRLCAGGCMILATLPFLVIPAIWLTDDLLRLVPGVGAGSLPSLPFRIIGIGISLLPAMPMAWGLMRLRRFFRRLAAGRTLTAGGAQDLNRFGIALLMRAVATPLAGAGVSVVASWERGPGERQLAIGVSNHDLNAVLVAGLVIITAWALAEAAEMADEHRLIV